METAAVERTPLVTVAACNLDQWALDFDGNLERVLRSIRQAKAMGARYRLGPELELCGYGCEDHFLEHDTFLHCDQSLAALLSCDATDDILCDIGMPVQHLGVRYNCRVFCLNRKILAIRPKLHLADDGNYRETRWFTTWKRRNETEDHTLCRGLAEVTGQDKVPFGQTAVSALDALIAGETCEELWTPDSPHIGQALAGVDIIGNGSGSHHQLRKLDTRLNYMISATAKCGGVYVYSNQRGCDGGRLYYDGCALIVVNGDVVAQAAQFSLADVEVITATVNLEDVRSYRASVSSRMEQASGARRLPTVEAPSFCLGTPGANYVTHPPTLPQALKIHSPQEECALGPACWLWDYLRRSGSAGFFLPLSGGADSSSVAAIVGVMCGLAVDTAAAEKAELSDMDDDAERKSKEGAAGVGSVTKEVRRLMGLKNGEEVPNSPRDLADCVLHTCFMGTENSSNATRTRASTLADQIGAYHSFIVIDTAVAAVVGIFRMLTGKAPRFLSRGGTSAEDLALQNIQARLRMVMAYLLAQLLPWVRGRQGFLLVLGSANVDEALRGYMTKYDCSSADLNPIGGISKVDLKKLLEWAARERGYTALADIAAAPPTAELRPLAEGAGEADEHSQVDEEDMGMTYEELSHFGRLRKVARCGPVSMFQNLLSAWRHLSPQEIASKVKRFFFFYSVNRHKMTTLTPSYHAEEYSPDDNRFDLRPFLYPTRWPRQFAVIDSMLKGLPSGRVDGKDA
ncbi:unnamed protein product [Ectocarpus fasciculatus]